MKKTRFLFGILAIAFIAFFTACEDEDPVGPYIDLSGGDFISSNTTVETGDDLPFKWNATKGDAKLTTFTIEMNGNIIPAWNNVEISNDESDSYSDSDTLQASTTPGTYKYAFIVEDKDGMTDTASVTITVEEAAPEGALKAEITNVKIWCTLGDGSVKSTCASADGSTYSPKTATVSEQSDIDFVYFYTSSAGIYSPSSVPTAINTTGTGIADWTTTNTTYLAKVTTDYSSVTFDDVVSLTESITTTSVTGLAENDVVAFITQEGQRGVFKVNEIEPGYNSTDYIIISIKVEE